MRLQSAAGDRAAAIHTYHRCVSILDKELGVAPDAATVALYGRLVASDRRSDTDRAWPTRVAERRAPGEPELVGRERELAALYVWQQGIVSGAAPLHLLRGEAGMGKSRLIREVAARAAAAGHSVAVARCYAGPGRIALSPVAEWLGSAPMRASRAQLDPEWRAEVDRLLPSDASDRASSRPSPMIDAWQRHHFFEGLARALLQSSRPTLLVLDDLQWCDAETLAWLPMFLGFADGYPIAAAGRRPRRADGRPPSARRHPARPARVRPLGRDRAHRAAGSSDRCARRQSPRARAVRAGRRPLAGGDGRRPAVRHRDGAQQAGARPTRQRGRPPAAGPGGAHVSPAGGLRTGSAGGGPRRSVRTRLLARAADRGERPLRGRDRRRRRRAVATPDHPRPRRREVRLHPRPAARGRVRADVPTTAAAAAPPDRAGHRAALRR